MPFAGRMFLAAMTVETAFMLAVSATLLALHDPVLPTGQIYALLGGFCTLAQLYFAYDAVFSENAFQYVSCHLTSLLFTFFVIWQVFRNPTSLGPAWEVARYEVMGIKLGFQVAYAVAAKPVWDSFGYFKWKMAGASITIGAMYARYRVFLSLIKYDLFSAMVLFLLVKVYLIEVADPDFYIGIISLAASIAFMVVGWFAITHERRPLLFLFYTLATLQPAYIIYKAWSLYEHPDLIPANVTVPQFIVLASLTMVVRLATLVSAVRCSYDFGQGLRELVFEGKRAAKSRVTRRRDDSRTEAFLAADGAHASVNPGGAVVVSMPPAVFGAPSLVQPPKY